MNIKELLNIDRFYCVTTFTNEERLENIIGLGQQLNIEIELIHAEIDDHPRMSFNRTMLKILNESKKSNHRIMIFEDDVSTELSNCSLYEKILQSDIFDYEYDVLSLGSICYKKCKINDHLYKADSFGYTHAVVYDLSNITNQFLSDLENNIIVNNMGYDSGLSITCYSYKGAIVFRESLFTQKNFQSISGGVSDIYNKSHRYKSKFEIDQNFEIVSIEKHKFEDPLNYLYLNFKLSDIYSFKFDFTKKAEFVGDNLVAILTDLDSGIIFNRTPAFNSNFWIVSEAPVNSIIVEIMHDKKCLFRKVLDLSKY